MDLITTLYIIMLAAFTGYEIIRRVPITLHTPLMSGANFIHGIVLVGSIIVLGHAHTLAAHIVGFIGVIIATLNAVGGYMVTIRMLALFKRPSNDSD